MSASRAQSESGLLAPFLPRALIARLARQPIESLAETIPCTMVFADVSGFTRLSERLARRGREGAEQLVDVINTCFSALLTEAYGRGGSLVKFGGDAMLLLFYDQEGDQQHAQRACCAAAAMRRRLREVGQVRAGDTHVVLRMSVGVHSGAYTMFVVGGSHRELLIGGPAASTVVELEAAAGSGQILIGPETARLLPRSSVGQAVGRGALLARSPTACEWVAPAGMPAPPQEVVARFLPDAVRTHLLSGSATPEHRTATIAFLQYGGLDEVIARDGAHSAGQRLDELVRVVQDAVKRYDVCFLDSDIAADGGKIRLSAGVPRVVGDDEERMLLALRHIVEADPPLPVRVGVHRGPVFTGPVGPAYRRWYAVMGDTVNLAARLGAKAPAGRIYATRDVLRRANTSFVETALDPFTAKGKKRPVQAWDVGPPLRGTSESAIRMELPVIGREHELERLRAAVATARRGSGTLIELVGETGSGKSRLLAEAERIAGGMATLRATCEVYTRDTPYAAAGDLLRQILGLRWDDPSHIVLERLKAEVRQAAPDLEPWLALIAIVLDVEMPPSREVRQLAPEARVAKLHEVVLQFLSRPFVVPTLVEVEHVELMDAASVALFEALGRELESSSWVVLVTRRGSGGLTLEGYDRAMLELSALSMDDTRMLAQATREAAELPPHVVELAVERSGGSPQFLFDLLAAAVAGNHDELPESVGAATMARIDALDPSDGAIVRRAAVLGTSFHPRRLRDVIGPDMVIPDERFWARLSGVFVRDSDGHVRFRRPALQEAAYASLPFKLRRQLHEAVGLRLEQEQDHAGNTDPAVLSNHFTLAGDHARTYRYAMAAAKRATERFSHADAVRLYQRAIGARRASGVADGAQALAEAWEQLGEELRFVGEPREASRALTEARRLLRDDPIAQARLCGRHAEVAARSEALSAAVRWLNRGFRFLAEADGPEAVAWRARMRSILGGVRNRQGRWADAVVTCRLAIEEAEAAGELRALAHACYSLDWALMELGHPEEATYSTRALGIYHQLGDPEREAAVLNNLGMFAYYDGRWDDAVALYRHAGECSERAGTPSDVARAEMNVAEILSDQGHLDEAEEHVRSARRVFGGMREPQALAYTDVLLGRIATRRGDRDTAVPTLEAAMGSLRRYKMDAYADFARALLAEAEAFTGDAGRALEIAHEELTVDRNQPLLERVAGIALARLGKRDAARTELMMALDSARERASQYDVAATIDVLDSLRFAEARTAERDEILERLRITRMPALPVGR